MLEQEDPRSELSLATLELAEAERLAAEAQRKAEEEVSRRLQTLGAKLQQEADRRVTDRSAFEQRWLKSIRQINAIYETEVLPAKEDKEEYGSELYVPLTRRLCNIAEARIGDICFPSDDRFYVLTPGAKPDLMELVEAAKSLPPESMVAVAGGQEPIPLADVSKAVDELIKDAEQRSSRMQRVIDDRLQESKFASSGRAALRDAIDLGTGVLKGPFPVRKRIRRWVPTGSGLYQLKVKDQVVAAYDHVSLWNWFPDMTTNDIQSMSSIFEMHPMTKLDLQGLLGQPGYLDAAIDRLLRGQPRADTSSRRKDLREISGVPTGIDDDRYIVWERHGSVTGADLKAAGWTETQVEDHLEYHSVVWLCDGVVIKAVLHPLDSNQRHIYSAVWWQRDRASPFGYGLPDEVRDMQDSANSAYRALHDNMGHVVGPQVVFDDTIIKPVDGKRNIRPWKLWRKTQTQADARQAFVVFQIESRLTELQAIFQLSKALMDEVATLPALQQGGDAPNFMQSATGASIAYNAASMWVRRVLRNWDDFVIEPLIGRAVEWEMDYNDDESIKGDHKPVARGVSALIELEGSGARMVQFAELCKGMGVPLKDQMRVLRQLARSLKLDPDEMLPTEEEIENMPDQGPDIEQLKVQVAQENNQMDHQAKMAELQGKEADRMMRAEEYARRERLALLEIASRERLTLETAAQKYGYELSRINADLQAAREQREHEARTQNAEIATKMKTGSGL